MNDEDERICQSLVRGCHSPRVKAFSTLLILLTARIGCTENLIAESGELAFAEIATRRKQPRPFRKHPVASLLSSRGGPIRTIGA